MVTVDESGLVITANSAITPICGVTPDLAIGRPFAELLVPAEPAQADELRSLMSISASDDCAHRIEIAVDGPGDAERWLEVLITPSREQAGTVVWLEDVTDRMSVAQRRISLMARAEEVAEIGSWEWVPGRSRLEWSDNLYRLFGLEPGAITPTLDFVMERAHPDDRDRLSRIIGFLGQEGHLAPFEYRILDPGHPMRRLRSTVTAVAGSGGVVDSVFGAVEDVTDEVADSQKIASHILTSEALEDWGSLESGAPRLLRDIAESLGFHAAALWVPREDALVARALWTADPHAARDFIVATRRLRPRRDEGLAGKVWQTGAPINVIDVATYAACARRETAVRAGLHGAVAFPALHGGDAIAVVELHCRDRGRLSRRLMQSLRAIGSELGQFLAHHRADLDSIELTARQLEVITLAAHGCSGPEIAGRLYISPSTVKSHLENIYAKLGVSDRATAVAEAIRHGLIE